MSVASELTWLIFDHDGSYFGELHTRGGAFVSVAFSDAGEQRMSAELREWQTHGVVLVREALQLRADDAACIIYEDRVPLRHPGCLNAIAKWADHHRIRLICLMPQMVVLWEKMLTLPLTDIERYAMVSAASRLPVSEISGWSTALDQATHAVGTVTKLPVAHI
ncbi:hypothetical protein KBC54_04795 [Patescibacteria group bacterium]|nr:hypothetical protein [Patescibacteria group bacterium]